MRRRASSEAPTPDGKTAARAPRTLVLWGERRSGKSGVIGALRSEGAKTVGERWALDLDSAPADAADYAESASLALRLRDVKETAVSRPDRPVTLCAKRFAGARAQESVQLTVLDPRGLTAECAFDTESHDIMHALATADGVIWLLDAREGVGAGARQRLLQQIVAALESASVAQLAVPVAIVMSKIDNLSAVEMRCALNSPEEIIRAQLGDAAFGWLVASCPRLRCFAISAAGTVRNAARPVGLSGVFDWFSSEWRRAERETALARTRERRSVHVANVRRRAPVAALAVTAAAVVVFAGGAAARRLVNRPTIWSSASGTIAAPASARETPRPSASPAAATVDSATADSSSRSTPSLQNAVATFQAGDVHSALQLLGAFRLPPTDTSWFAADSVLAVVALGATEAAMRASPTDTALLRLVVSTTSPAIARAHPGTYVLAPLSLARAEACIAGRLDCPAERLREDLAWALLFGSPAQQDGARRLRAAWLADSSAGGS